MRAEMRNLRKEMIEFKNLVGKMNHCKTSEAEYQLLSTESVNSKISFITPPENSRICKSFKINDHLIRELWDEFKWANIRIIGISEGQENN